VTVSPGSALPALWSKLCNMCTCYISNRGGGHHFLYIVSVENPTGSTLTTTIGPLRSLVSAAVFGDHNRQVG